jgi:hypothetical protein
MLLLLSLMLLLLLLLLGVLLGVLGRTCTGAGVEYIKLS